MTPVSQPERAPDLPGREGIYHSHLVHSSGPGLVVIGTTSLLEVQAQAEAL